MSAINFIADPNSVLFGNLKIKNYPYAIIINKMGIVTYSTTCYSVEEIEMMIDTALQE